MTVKFVVGAGSDGEGPQQQVQGVPDGAHVRVGAEVADTRSLPSPHHRGPGPFLVDGDGQPRIALVILQADVVARLELLDEVVLEQQGLALGADDHPFHVIGLLDHLSRPGAEGTRVLEIGVQPLPQGLRLAHVEHPTVSVHELVRARVVRDRPGGWSGHHRPSVPRPGPRSYHCSLVVNMLVRRPPGFRAPIAPGPTSPRTGAQAVPAGHYRSSSPGGMTQDATAPIGAPRALYD